MFDIDPEQLIARAEALVAAADDALFPRRDRDVEDAGEARRFAAVLMGARGRVEDLPLLVELHARSPRWRDHDSTDAMLEATLRGLVPRASPRDEAIVALAHSDLPRERLLVAAYLSVDTPAGHDLVAGLLADRDADVREAAAEQLPDMTPPWWAAAFSRDPTAHLAPEAVEALEPALQTIILGIDDAEDDPEALYAALEQLPTPALFDVVTRVFSQRPNKLTWQRPLLSLVLERPGGPAVVLACAEELPEPWVLGFGGKERWLLRGTDPRRAELALALGDALLGAEENDLWHPLMRLIAAEWPKKVDPAPLIERVLAHPDRDDARALTLDVAANAHAETWGVRLLEARLAGDTRLDAALGDHFDALIARCHRHVLRPLAERGLRVDSCVEWAVRALLGRCHDRERDPPRGQLARAWVADPRMSEAVRKARPDLVRGWLRARLARGQASLAEAVSLLRVDDVDDEAHWTEIRRLRAEALAGPDPDALAIMATLELTRWGPDEWAAVDEFMNRIPRASWFMVRLLCRLTALEAVPRVERLLGRVSSHAQGPLLAHRRALAQLYGLELGPPPPPRDEDEDDDD